MFTFNKTYVHSCLIVLAFVLVLAGCNGGGGGGDNGSGSGGTNTEGADNSSGNTDNGSGDGSSNDNGDSSVDNQGNGSGDSTNPFVLVKCERDIDGDGVINSTDSYYYEKDRNVVRRERITAGSDESTSTHILYWYFDSSGRETKLEEDFFYNGSDNITYHYYDSTYCVRTEIDDGKIGIVDSPPDGVPERTYTYAYQTVGDHIEITVDNVGSNPTPYKCYYYPSQNLFRSDIPQWLLNNAVELKSYYDDNGNETRCEAMDSTGKVVYVERNYFDNNNCIIKNEVDSNNDNKVDRTYYYTWERRDISGMNINFASIIWCATNKNEPSLVWQLLDRILPWA